MPAKLCRPGWASQDSKTPSKKKEVIKDEEELDLSKIFNNTEEKNTESSSSINQSLEDSIRKKIGTN